MRFTLLTDSSVETLSIRLPLLLFRSIIVQILTKPLSLTKISSSKRKKERTFNYLKVFAKEINNLNSSPN